MSRRVIFADDDPVLQQLDTLPGDELASLRVDYGRMAQIKAAEQTRFHARIARITRILHSRQQDRWEITDHAVIRYLERVKKLDISAIRKEIGALVSQATDRVAVKGEAVGLTFGDLLFVVVRDRLVVTVHAPDEPLPPTQEGKP